MDQEKFTAYIRDRYESEICWYERKSANNKRAYTALQWGVTVLSAALPVLIAYTSEEHRWLTVSIGVILAIGTSGLKTFKFQELWLNYRTIAETLKKERHFYEARLDAYARATDPEALFVERVESVISRENTLWITVQQQSVLEEPKQLPASQDSIAPGDRPPSAPACK